MPLESYRIWLRDGIYLHIIFVQADGEVVRFAVVLVAQTEDGELNAARYDSAHGMAHRDVLGRRKGLLHKRWFPNVPFGKVLNLAIADFKAHYESYLQIFEKN